jgi:hypothetical protein
MKTGVPGFVFSLSLLAISMRAEVPTHSFVIMSEGTTIISDADVIEYRFAEHTLKIRGESLLRVGRLRPPISGTVFHVVVDGEPVYSGRFVPVFSSMSFKEPTILAHLDTNQPTATVIISGPSFHEPQFQSGKDPRLDTRVTRALAGLGKLTAGFHGGANHDEAFTERLAEILAECEKMTPGTTRAEFLKIFEIEGGLRRKASGTFVHRHCPYIKVDVEFTDSARQKAVEERPSDTISRISKPYLARSIFD